MTSHSGVLAELEAAIPAVQRYARHLTRDHDRSADLVQDCLERAMSHIDKYEANTNMRSWLFTIMRNIMYDQMRQKKRRGVHVEYTETAETVPLHVNLDVHEDADALRDLQRAFDQLSRGDRQILLCIAVDGLSYEQTSERLGIELGTVKSRLFRARRRLRSLQEGIPKENA